MPRTGLAVPALGLAAVALVASGCGGSSKKASTTAASTASTTATTPAVSPPAASIKVASGRPLTQAGWIAKGDAICSRANEKLATSIITSISNAPRVFRQISVYMQIEAQELSKLVPPKPATHDWAQIVNGLQLDSRYQNTMAGYAQEKKFTFANPLVERSANLHKHVAELAGRHGFKECSLPGLRRR
jgi:hypothetical protein